MWHAASVCFIFETEKESRFIYSTVVLNCKNTAYFSCVVFLSITVMHMTDASPFLFVFNRVLDTLIGVGIALIVNTVHLPRK
ncbi:MAG TPA: FUSC family protein, partial [Blautia sp.]|nr:FUSC family protein [Blautia sp.]